MTYYVMAYANTNDNEENYLIEIDSNLDFIKFIADKIFSQISEKSWLTFTNGYVTLVSNEGTHLCWIVPTETLFARFIRSEMFAEFNNVKKE